jgi:hypothetical protein
VRGLERPITMISDDIPWADPSIRTEYEAALGRFILAFNEVDFGISKIIACEILKRGRSDLAESAAKSPFVQRLETLDILASTTTHSALAALSVAKLRSLNGDRNKLAHGHFDQNPFDGSYTLILKAKTGDYPTVRVRKLAEELAEFAEQLRHMEAMYEFEEVTESPELCR